MSARTETSPRRTIRKIIKDVWRRKPQDPVLSFYVPESVRYAVKYGVDVKSALEIPNRQGYEMMSLYFGPKLLDKEPDLQRLMLGGMVTTFFEGGGYGEATKIMNKILLPNGIQRDDIKWTQIEDSQKLARIASCGPHQQENKVSTTHRDVKDNGELPVIIGYGGLFGLMAAVKMMDVGDKFFIVLPKKTDSQSPGYKVIRSESGIELSSLDTDDLVVDGKMALIDDVRLSGETFEQVISRFPNAQIRQTTYFRH